MANPVSSSELSVQVRSICESDTPMAARSNGASGGAGGGKVWAEAVDQALLPLES
ncbi:hypothetical protein ES703_87461 [subsurface metagenome]